MEVTWNKWERVTMDRTWLAKTIWAFLKLKADEVNPNHPLLAAFNEALKEADMSDTVGENEGGRKAIKTGGDGERPFPHPDAGSMPEA